MRRLLALFVLLEGASAASAATFTVTNTNDSGAGSLREAINQANMAAGADTIAFNVSGAGCDGSGVCTIAPSSQLPSATGTVLIDGYTQPGSSPNTNATGTSNAVLKVVLSGPAVTGGHGIDLAGAGSTVRGLVINGGFFRGVSLSAPSTAVRGCFIGTNAAGTAPVPNARGVYGNGFGGGTGITVGGPAPADRNLIAGHTAQEVWFEAVDDGTIEGNLLGTDKTGAASFDDFPGNGVILSPVMGATLIRGNVVAGGDGGAILVGNFSPSAFETIVQGNYIGTDVTG